jgi:2-methylcitrate dehydratase
MTEPLADRLAEYAGQLRFEDLPARAVHEVKRRLIDSLGVAVAAQDSDAYLLARRCALRVLGQPSAGLFGGGRTSAEWATFVNGLLIGNLDYNDAYVFHEVAHPSDNLAAVLAVGEIAGADGRELITATVLAYETHCRLCGAASLRVNGWDEVGYGAISSCLAAAKLLRLDPLRMIHAIAIAATCSNALRQTRIGQLSMWAGCASANAARNGVFASLLAAEGVRGPAPIFEGERGFMTLLTGAFELPALGGDGGGFMIVETHLRAWPADYHAQTAIDAALYLREGINDVEQVESIDIHTCSAAAGLIAGDPEKWRPLTRETAGHSLPYCTAVALTDGEVTPMQFAPDRFSDEKLLDLVARTQVHDDPVLSERYPVGIPNRVAVNLTDGNRLMCEVEFPRGHAHNPMTDADLEQKFRKLVEPRLGKERSDAILAACWDLDRMKTPTDLLDLMA